MLVLLIFAPVRQQSNIDINDYYDKSYDNNQQMNSKPYDISHYNSFLQRIEFQTFFMHVQALYSNKSTNITDGNFYDNKNRKFKSSIYQLMLL